VTRLLLSAAVVTAPAGFARLALRRSVDVETCADTYHDMGTNDFLTGLMEQHEKMAWMLRAFLEGPSV